MNRLWLTLALAALAACRGTAPAPALTSGASVQVSMGVGGVT